MNYVRYIDKTREYYLGEGYETPYQWAHFDDMPFTPLRKPPSACRVGLITTSEMALRSQDQAAEDDEDDWARDPYSLPSDTPMAQLYSRKDSYDSYATTLDDVDSYLPLTHMHALASEGRIASLAPRFHVVFSQYSQRKTSQVDAPKILRWCIEDKVDVAVLTAV